jgi:hypothetical protein
MIEELVEVVWPGGALVAGGLALGVAFSRQLRPVAKEAIKLGMTAGTVVQEAAAEVYERGQDLVAEARYEREHGEAAHESGSSDATPAPAARRTRRAPAAEPE